MKQVVMSTEEYRALYVPTKSGKYRAVRTTFNGITFDSKAECVRYQLLLSWQRSGEISNLVCQPRYELEGGCKVDGKTIRSVTYVADFRYVKNGQTIIEDVKGARTQLFNVKEKLFRVRYPELDLRLMKKTRSGWEQI